MIRCYGQENPPGQINPWGFRDCIRMRAGKPAWSHKPLSSYLFLLSKYIENTSWRSRTYGSYWHEDGHFRCSKPEAEGIWNARLSAHNSICTASECCILFITCQLKQLTCHFSVVFIDCNWRVPIQHCIALQCHFYHFLYISISNM